MPGGSKKGGGLEVKSAYKKQKFGEAASPFTMKGSPHKLGTIEGTEAYKASIAKFAVEQTRTSGDATLVGAASELGGSYVPSSQDYSIKTGFTVTGELGKKKKKKKNGKKKDEKKDKEKVIIPREEDEIKVKGAKEQAHWQSGGGFGEKTFIDPAHKASKPKKKIRVKGQPYTGKEVRKKKNDAWESSWSEYI